MSWRNELPAAAPTQRLFGGPSYPSGATYRRSTLVAWRAAAADYRDVAHACVALCCAIAVAPGLIWWEGPLQEEDRVVCIRFGHDWDETCMQMDEASCTTLPVSLGSAAAAPLRHASCYYLQHRRDDIPHRISV